MPTQRVALMMAELEEAEHGDEGRAREWTARAVRAGRDPAWTADGYVSDRWLPVSPVSGRIDAFEWKLPVAELAPPRDDDFAPIPAPAAAEPEVIAPYPAEVEVEAVPVVSLPPEPETQAATPGLATDAVAETAPDTSEAEPVPPSRPRSRSPTRSRTMRPPEAINPLVRAPDDPGPEPASEPAADRRHLHDLLK
jgi:HemY protein